VTSSLSSIKIDVAALVQRLNVTK